MLIRRGCESNPPLTLPMKGGEIVTVFKKIKSGYFFIFFLVQFIGQYRNSRCQLF